jgi:hypothetical protein
MAETKTTVKVPTELWIRAKIEVLREGTTLQAKIRELIRQWLDSKAEAS